MNPKIETIKNIRRFLLELISELSTEQLNEVPTGFNNNIVWNLGHLVAAQQGICYFRSNVPMVVSEEYFNNFKGGSKPERAFSPDEIDQIKQLLIDSLDQFERDLNNKLFVTYTSVITRYGIEFKHIDDAIEFLPFHEGLHMGTIMALKKLVKK
jgi:hypothetical protein